MSDSDGNAGSNGPLFDTGERDDSGPAESVAAAGGADGGESGVAEDSDDSDDIDDIEDSDDIDDIDDGEAGRAGEDDPRSYNGVRSSKVVVV